jgi:DNA-binding CsgD family transcriptional regulator
VTDLSNAIDAFFAATFDPARWTEALDLLSQAAGADGASLVFGHSSPNSVAGSASIHGFMADYFQMAVDDSREERVAPTLRDGFTTDLQFYARAEIDRDPFYQDFLKPRGHGWHGVALLGTRPDDIVLSLKRSLRRGPYERHELDQLDKLLPYMRAAATAAAAAHAGALGAQLAALARAGLGAITLDRHGRVIESNGAVELGDGLAVVGDEIRTSLRADQPALDAAIAQALRPEHPSRLPPPRRLVLRRQLARRPLVVDVLPLIGACGVALSRAAALLVINDLGRTERPDIADLRAVFGLTAREAELAARLAAGMPLETAAGELRITKAHARQRLKVIFQKTDTHRQAELAALLARLPRLDRPRG